ncbi:MAG: hypothetical protein HY754_12160 [Nitrospirae bacterium]|nr:hypothetical protein [Nitrospirota bacterium]
MHTLFDFLTYVKGIEYIIAVLFIVGYILYWELLKPRPFKSLVHTAKDDLAHIKRTGTMQTVRKIATAPFIGLAYIVALPFVFMFTLGTTVINGILGLAGREASFGWRPTEAYLAGKKKEKGEDKQDEEK